VVHHISASSAETKGGPGSDRGQHGVNLHRPTPPVVAASALSVNASVAFLLQSSNDVLGLLANNLIFLGAVPSAGPAMEMEFRRTIGRKGLPHIARCVPHRMPLNSRKKGSIQVHVDDAAGNICATLGPGTYCSPRHSTSMPFDSSNEGSKASNVWRALRRHGALPHECRALHAVVQNCNWRTRVPSNFNASRTGFSSSNSSKSKSPCAPTWRNGMVRMSCSSSSVAHSNPSSSRQGLTLVHFSAQLEPFFKLTTRGVSNKKRSR